MRTFCDQSTEETHKSSAYEDYIAIGRSHIVYVGLEWQVNTRSFLETPQGYLS